MGCREAGALCWSLVVSAGWHLGPVPAGVQYGFTVALNTTPQRGSPQDISRAFLCLLLGSDSSRRGYFPSAESLGALGPMPLLARLLHMPTQSAGRSLEELQRPLQVTTSLPQVQLFLFNAVIIPARVQLSSQVLG